MGTAPMTAGYSTASYKERRRSSVGEQADAPFKFYTTNQVAEMFAVKNFTVRQWISDGMLKAVRLNTEWRIAEADLKDFAERLMADDQATERLRRRQGH
jgi:excisionase family DNA binding protein